MEAVDLAKHYGEDNTVCDECRKAKWARLAKPNHTAYDDFKGLRKYLGLKRPRSIPNGDLARSRCKICRLLSHIESLSQGPNFQFEVGKATESLIRFNHIWPEQSWTSRPSQCNMIVKPLTSVRDNEIFLAVLG